MHWKEGTKIAIYAEQVHLHKKLRRVVSGISEDGWMSKKDCAEELQNIILDFWGSMGPDCIPAPGCAWLP